MAWRRSEIVAAGKGCTAALGSIQTNRGKTMRKLKTKKGLAMLTVAAMALLGIGYGLFNAFTAEAATSGTTIRGVVGGDFDSELPAGSINGADWGVDTTLI